MLNLAQKTVIAQVINYLGFFIPVCGKGIKKINIAPSDIEYAIIDGDNYLIKTRLGSNSFPRNEFREIVQTLINNEQKIA
jgi:hypothetical protein